MNPDWSKLAVNRTKYMTESEMDWKGLEIFMKPLKSRFINIILTTKWKNLRKDDIIDRLLTTGLAANMQEAEEYVNNWITNGEIDGRYFIKELICPDGSKIYRIKHVDYDGVF